MADYRQNWQVFRGLKQHALILAIGIPSLVIASALLDPLHSKRVEIQIGFSFIAIVLLLLMVFTVMRIEKWRCPRCARSFEPESSGKLKLFFTEKCANCGLHKYETNRDVSTEAETSRLKTARSTRGPRGDATSAEYNAAEVMLAFEEEDYEYVLREALPHAVAGNPGAQCMISLLYQFGFAVPRDLAKAEDWLLKASAQDDPLAWNNLGTLYAVGGSGLSHGPEKAQECYLRARELGFACEEPHPPRPKILHES
jgi:hypothetical protein